MLRTPVPQGNGAFNKVCSTQSLSSLIMPLRAVGAQFAHAQCLPMSELAAEVPRPDGPPGSKRAFRSLLGVRLLTAQSSGFLP